MRMFCKNIYQKVFRCLKWLLSHSSRSLIPWQSTTYPLFIDSNNITIACLLDGIISREFFIENNKFFRIFLQYNVTSKVSPLFFHFLIAFYYFTLLRKKMDIKKKKNLLFWRFWKNTFSAYPIMRTTPELCSTRASFFIFHSGLLFSF